MKYSDTLDFAQDQDRTDPFVDAMRVKVEKSPAFEKLPVSCQLDSYRKHMDTYAM